MDLPNLSEKVLQKAKNIKLLIMDVDGVLSDGKVYYSNAGDEIKTFNIKDGLGIKLLHSIGVKTAIITGRSSHIVERRAKELGISEVFQGKSDKRQAFKDLQNKFNLNAEEIAHIGDDLPDLPLMNLAGLGIAVADAHWFVKQNADWVTVAKGGEGAVRNTVDLLLTAKDKFAQCYEQYLQ